MQQVEPGTRVSTTVVTSRKWWRRSWWGCGSEEPAEADDVQGEGREEDAWVEGQAAAKVICPGKAVALGLMAQCAGTCSRVSQETRTPLAWLAFKDFPTLIMTRCFESNLIGLDQQPTRMASSTSNWTCLAGNERRMWKEPLCIIGEADLFSRSRNVC